MRAFLIITALAFTVTALGCGTVKGIGEDLRAVGGWFIKGSDSATEQK